MAGRGRKSGTAGKKRKKKIRDHEHLSPLISLVASATTAAHSFLTQNDLHLHPSQTLSLESNVASTALSLTKLNSLFEALNPSTTVTTLISPLSSSPSSCWFQRFLSAASDDSDPRWVEVFRMSKPSFTFLLETLSPSLRNSFSTTSPDYVLGAALFRLAHAAPFKSVGRRFGLDSAGSCRAFYTVCKLVNNQLSHLLELTSDFKRITEGFSWISLPNCFGVLGFIKFHIDGDGLGKDGAIIVQALVDSEGRFLDISAGWPSSMSPYTILRQTKFFLRVEESKELLNGPPSELSEGNLVPQYVLGDSCCPLLPWLITPFSKPSKDDSNSMELAFNSTHNRGMELVSKAFARVRARWRLLSVNWKEKCMESFPFVIVTGCLLHNFLAKQSEPLPDETEDYLMEQKFPLFDGQGNESGERVRAALASHLSLVSQRR
ncbi:PREDICTED: putative nuclease HARBI1 [Nelumbo nucifera]|uniref:Nuclease HARBI1 n=1 Tax=Nelumbo nucifera TaxID=4432 RepID=A0A1U7ZFU5_NELNU|nr:PREDICTED: putative nuclease HARBI1 [Nelumbo nucifera]